MGEALGSEVADLQGRIRSLIRAVRARVQPTTAPSWAAKGSEIWEGRLDGRPVERVVIYLRSSGCVWALTGGCLDCEHSLADTTVGVPVSAQDYVTQFASEFAKYDFARYPVLCLYNEGSILCEQELPADALESILARIAGTSAIRSVVLESLPQYIDDRSLATVQRYLGDRIVEIGIGLESSSPIVRALCVNKPFSLHEYRAAMVQIGALFRPLSYVMLKPTFLNESEAIDDAVVSTRYAFEAGAAAVSIEPVNAGVNSVSGALFSIGEYRPPWLWSVVAAVRAVHGLGEIRVGGHQYAPAYSRAPANCPSCTPRFAEAISNYNRTGDISTFDSLDCDCRIDWLADLKKDGPALPDRVRRLLPALEEAAASTR